jgi:hypothetical protein
MTRTRRLPGRTSLEQTTTSRHRLSQPKQCTDLESHAQSSTVPVVRKPWVSIVPFAGTIMFADRQCQQISFLRRDHGFFMWLSLVEDRPERGMRRQ